MNVNDEFHRGAGCFFGCVIVLAAITGTIIVFTWLISKVHQ
jgi:hypothetical protein